jgi:hypothetical protein
MFMVSGREYISCRVRRVVDGVVYTSGHSVDNIPNMPETNGKIRAMLHVGGGRFEAHPTKPNTTIFDMIMCVDFKGMIPKSLISSVGSLSNSYHPPFSRRWVKC